MFSLLNHDFKIKHKYLTKRNVTVQTRIIRDRDKFIKRNKT